MYKTKWVKNQLKNKSARAITHQYAHHIYEDIIGKYIFHVDGIIYEIRTQNFYFAIRKNFAKKTLISNHIYIIYNQSNYDLIFPFPYSIFLSEIL